ncbi:hypothetical protein [Wenyingzhuangia sp. 2_MG-2023]|uniref:hypothetical protein n=1 Tax=Wenyingzhuangia sp. 2_MG-2023 TaxID=3062639 RepID=UPI0026E271DB|nr:hypothetical protein [Wenyingzhuangia sp. 2_MG-2023]MDO6738597.1 hypothetical protein [Wenyingzhuangia sp. 2_MG-2023]MDO6802871.1 hypothetical protein [Wenyingzhuangia sp. 1_MG-2023]
MNRIKVKFIVGLIFSIAATAVYSYFNFETNHLELMYIDRKNIITKFLIFFLLGYIVIGNSFAPDK